MAKTCVTEKTAQRQRWIEGGLLELMGTRSFETITVTELCGYLALSRRSFYRYFRDMEDVLDSLLNHTFQDLAMADQVLSLEELEVGYRFWYQRRELLDALHLSNMTEKLFEYTCKYTDLSAIGRYLAPDDLQMVIGREASLFVTSGFVAMILAWHADGFRKTPEQMARIAYRMLFSPILKQP